MDGVASARGPGEVHPLPAAGEGGVEQRVGRRQLDLLIPAEVAARVEEDLYDVGLVERLVVLGERGRNVRVLRLEGDVEVVVVPEQTRDRLDGAGLSVQRTDEGTGALRPVPRRLGQHSIDLDRPARAVDHVLAGTLGARCEQEEKRGRRTALARAAIREPQAAPQTRPARRTIRRHSRSCPPSRLEN